MSLSSAPNPFRGQKSKFFQWQIQRNGFNKKGFLEHAEYFYILSEKSTFLAGGGTPPPSLKNSSFVEYSSVSSPWPIISTIAVILRLEHSRSKELKIVNFVHTMYYNLQFDKSYRTANNM